MTTRIHGVITTMQTLEFAKPHIFLFAILSVGKGIPAPNFIFLQRCHVTYVCYTDENPHFPCSDLSPGTSCLIR